MTKRQSSKLNMYLALISYCDETGNLALIATILALNTTYSAFKTTVSAIVSAGTILQTPIGGVTGAKKTSKKTLAKFGSNLAGIVSAFALDTNNEELHGEMQITESDIFRARGLTPVEICTLIYNRANANAAALADYGITTLILTAFQNAITDFNSNEPKPKVTIDMKKAKRIELASLFSDADNLLESKMDQLMVNFAETSPNFLQTYTVLRKPVKPAVPGTVLKLLIVNGANDMPIKNAKSYHNGNPGAKKSSEKGFVTYKSPDEGNHYFIIKHSLFKNTTSDKIMIAHGKKKVVTIKMEAN